MRSSSAHRRDDIIGVLKDVYAACLENGDKVATHAYRAALQNVAQPLPLGRLDPEVQLIALEACTDLGFWELCDGLLRCAEQLFSLSGPLLRAVRIYARGLHADDARELLWRLIAEAQKHSSRDAWRYWTLVAALDHCANSNISIQRSAALELVAYALSEHDVNSIPDLERQQITVALLYRMCPEHPDALTNSQATQFNSAIAYMDAATCLDNGPIEKFCDAADEVVLQSSSALTNLCKQTLDNAAEKDPEYGHDALGKRIKHIASSIVSETRSER